jgi:hypothetical protein
VPVQRKRFREGISWGQNNTLIECAWKHATNRAFKKYRSFISRVSAENSLNKTHIACGAMVFRSHFPYFNHSVVFTRALHWSLSWARPIQSIPSHPISLWSVLTLSTYLRIGLLSGLFLSGFPTNILYAFLFSLIRATSAAHLILLDLIILIILGEERFNQSYCYNHQLQREYLSMYYITLNLLDRRNPFIIKDRTKQLLNIICVSKILVHV